MQIHLNDFEAFRDRHNSATRDLEAMLQTVKAESLDQLIDETVPENIRLPKPMELPEALTETEYLKALKQKAAKNKLFQNHIGAGYYGTHTPNVILRNILENPGWYTAYTPYQAEIAQGRLEMLMNFQTLIIDLTGLPIANASLLDEGTAAAEAARVLYNTRKGKKKKTAHKIFVADHCHPQTLAVLKNRCDGIGIQLHIAPLETLDLTDESLYAIMVQYPDTDGQVRDYRNLFATAAENDVRVAVATDLLALTLLTPPGEIGADIVFGTAQRLGVPMGYGGPHAAFFATQESYKRQVPGRIIGLSKDAEGKPAFRMALQTREQHIKREKATSNICTAQVLLAVMSAAYAVYHGPEGLTRIAARTHGLARSAAEQLQGLGYSLLEGEFFDTLKVLTSPEEAKTIREIAEAKEVNFRYFDGGEIGLSFDETHRVADLENVLSIFAEAKNASAPKVEKLEVSISFPEGIARTSDFLTHENFHSYRTEHEMLRYLKRLENKDLSLVHSMISLGSCTMKLNATAEMMPVTWPEFCNLHPFVPAEQAEGYAEMLGELKEWLCEITGFDAVSLQPNSGAQGEYAGLMAIRSYHHHHGDTHREIALIPSSAHGTNPASAVMAGMKVVIVDCDEKGNIKVDDLREKAEKYKDTLSCLMITYPSTHGVFEESVVEICDIIHEHGGRVYMDGANMNAQVGLTSPGRIGADVCHLNLHKTFCIPHGGGGPGMGPIGVVKDLAPFLPGHPLVEVGGEHGSEPISAAPYGSADILTISHAYIAMMGADGLTQATAQAILNANYLKDKLSDHFKVLYVGTKGRAAHEFIIDCRHFKEAGIDSTDIAKRLMDFGYHAPTMSFPVPGTLMIEPTESETKAELDRFVDALVQIRKEIQAVQDGQADSANNVLVNAPHPAHRVLSSDWNAPYSREEAAYPLDWVRENKFWPPVSRIDNAWGDRHLVCACLPTEAYEEMLEA